MKGLGFLYRYFFYRIYSLAKRFNKRNTDNKIVFNSVVLLTVLLSSSIITVLITIERKYSLKSLKTVLFFSFILIFLLNSLLFFKVFNSNQIVQEFSKESKQAKGISIILTIIISLLLLYPLLKIVYDQLAILIH